MVAVSVTSSPGHAGPSLAAVAFGGELMVTVVVAGAEGQPFTVTVTEYVPAAAAVMPFITGFCWVEVNPLGPLHW